VLKVVSFFGQESTSNLQVAESAHQLQSRLDWRQSTQLVKAEQLSAVGIGGAAVDVVVEVVVTVSVVGIAVVEVSVVDTDVVVSVVVLPVEVNVVVDDVVVVFVMV
jgi:hypothetical protein